MPADWLPKRGDRVRIKKGARVKSTHPQHRGVVLSKRAQVVTVHSAYAPVPDSWAGAGRPGEVHWAGSAGYWRWCPLDDCEPVDAADAR